MKAPLLRTFSPKSVATNTGRRQVTRAMGNYLREQKRIEDLLDWFIVSAMELDRAVIARTRLEIAVRPKGITRPKELFVGAGARRIMASKWFYDLMAEMAICRVVDNYLTYVVDLLALVFRSKPDCLKSSEQVGLDFVLAYPTRPKLIRAIADRQVNKLSYQGMRDLDEFTSNRLGLALFTDETQLSKAVELIEMRNLLVHGRGTVNRIFLNRVRSSKYRLGQHLHFSFADVRNHAEFLRTSAENAESRAHRKFGFALPVRLNSRGSGQAGSTCPPGMPRALPWKAGSGNRDR